MPDLSDVVDALHALEMVDRRDLIFGDLAVTVAADGGIVIVVIVKVKIG